MPTRNTKMILTDLWIGYLMVSVNIYFIKIATGISSDGFHSMTPENLKQWPTVDNPYVQ